MEKINVTNNIFNGETIVSYDPYKTWIINVNNEISFCKKTNKSEIKY